MGSTPAMIAALRYFWLSRSGGRSVSDGQFTVAHKAPKGNGRFLIGDKGDAAPVASITRSNGPSEVPLANPTDRPLSTSLLDATVAFDLSATPAARAARYSTSNKAARCSARPKRPP